MKKQIRLIGFRPLRAKCGDPDPSTIWRWVKAGELPAPIKLGGRALWDEDEVDERLAAKLAAREVAA